MSPRTSARYRLGLGLVITGERNPVRSPNRVSRLEVACASCGAQPGDRCLTLEGVPRMDSHRARIRIATRKYNESPRITGREPVTVLVRANRDRHVLEAGATLCGIAPNVRLAQRRGLIHKGMSREITCQVCLAAFEHQGEK